MQGEKKEMAKQLAMGLMSLSLRYCALEDALGHSGWFTLCNVLHKESGEPLIFQTN